jgi:hypothetical protein
MTYSAPGQFFLKKGLGTDSKVVAAELKKIETELESRIKIAKVALTGGAVNSFAFVWVNQETVPIMVQRVLVDIKTAGATATSVIDIGPAADATSTSDTIIDGLALTSTGLFDNITDKGTNGKSRIRLDERGGTTSYITGKILTANAAELVGNVYIEYIKV